MFLGIQIERRKDKLIIHQRNYIRRLLERFNAPENPLRKQNSCYSGSSNVPHALYTPQPTEAWQQGSRGH